MTFVKIRIFNWLFKNLFFLIVKTWSRVLQLISRHKWSSLVLNTVTAFKKVSFKKLLFFGIEFPSRKDLILATSFFSVLNWYSFVGLNNRIRSIQILSIVWRNKFFSLFERVKRQSFQWFDFKFHRMVAFWFCLQIVINLFFFRSIHQQKH